MNNKTILAASTIIGVTALLVICYNAMMSIVRASAMIDTSAHSVMYVPSELLLNLLMTVLGTLLLSGLAFVMDKESMLGSMTDTE